MPCRDFEGVTEEQWRHATELSTLQKKIDKLTRIACEVFKTLDVHHMPVKSVVSEEAYAWWIDHKKQDYQRVRREALEKLTPEEREVLGVS